MERSFFDNYESFIEDKIVITIFGTNLSIKYSYTISLFIKIPTNEKIRRIHTNNFLLFLIKFIILMNFSKELISF
jgi:hypothetical protein